MSVVEGARRLVYKLGRIARHPQMDPWLTSASTTSTWMRNECGMAIAAGLK